MTENHEGPPAATEEPPAWWTAPAPPAGVLEQLTEAGDWRALGVRRWAGAVANVSSPDLLVLVNADGTGFMRYPVDLADDDMAVIVGDLFDDMQARLDREALPECVAPGCTDKGAALFHAAALGHLAGEVYNAGDPIRMCWRHSNDVLSAGERLDQIAEWLRPDAEALDPHHPAVTASIHRTRALLPRMLRPAGDPA